MDGQMEKFIKFYKLSDSQHQELMSLTTDQLNIKIKDLMTWTDDHEFCFNVIINEVELSMWWVDPKYYAACMYAHVDESAANKVIELIHDRYQMFEQSLED